ncbi:ABC transporter permease [Celeribacter sp.]|uniref:ABC transporter permease n=1 Tax=Celeribacter sp. TaxID=1890673 RepID=UPI003A8CC642
MDATTNIQVPARQSFMERINPYVSIFGPLLMIAMLMVFMLLVEPARFFRLSNFEIVFMEAAMFMPMAVGMTFVIAQRGIDLSIGSIAALSALIMAFMIKQYGFSPYVGILIAITVGATLGAINGMVVTKLNVPDLIGTMAMDLIYRGIALVLAKGLVLAKFPEIIKVIGRGRIEGFLPVPVLIGIFTIVAGYFVLTRTFFGRYALGIGSDPEAAEMAGIAVDRQRVYAYSLMGALAGLGGVMLAGKLNSIQATSASFLNLHVIAAVVVGGTSLFGGRASMLGAFCGVILLAMITNATIILRIEFFWQSVAAGIVIVVSVAAYSWLQSKDKDVTGNLWAKIGSRQNLSILKFIGGLIAALIALFILGAALPGAATT